jgi:hypothetical protein
MAQIDKVRGEMAAALPHADLGEYQRTAPGARPGKPVRS